MHHLLLGFINKSSMNFKQENSSINQLKIYFLKLKKMFWRQAKTLWLLRKKEKKELNGRDN